MHNIKFNFYGSRIEYKVDSLFDKEFLEKAYRNFIVEDINSKSNLSVWIDSNNNIGFLGSVN